MRKIPIDKISFLATDNNYYQECFNKKQIVIDVSLRQKNNHIIRQQHLKLGNSKSWPMFSISREGKIYQHFNEKYYSDFIGNKNIDKNIISIVLENMGTVNQIENNYINCLNETCNKENIVNIKWLELYFWEKIYDIQLKNCGLLCYNICDKFNINKTCIDFFHYHKNILNFNGVVFKSNFFQNSMNFNPSFSFEKFNNYLNNNQK